MAQRTIYFRVRAHKECETTKNLELRRLIGTMEYCTILEIGRNRDKRYPINAGVDCRFAVLAISIKSRHPRAAENNTLEPCAGQQCGLQCRLSGATVPHTPCGACLAPLSPPTTVAGAIERLPKAEASKVWETARALHHSRSRLRKIYALLWTNFFFPFPSTPQSTPIINPKTLLVAS